MNSWRWMPLAGRAKSRYALTAGARARRCFSSAWVGCLQLRARWLSLRTELAVFDTIGRQPILGQTLAGLVDFQPVAVFQDFNLVAFGSRHPIVIGAKGQVTILVSAPTMVPIGRGQMGRQLGQVIAFMLEGFGRNQPCLALRLVVQAHRGPI